MPLGVARASSGLFGVMYGVRDCGPQPKRPESPNHCLQTSSAFRHKPDKAILELDFKRGLIRCKLRLKKPKAELGREPRTRSR